MAQQASEDLHTLLHPTQTDELRALRAHAFTWMQRLAEFSPHLTHDVFGGSATQDSDIWLRLFPQDPKAVEIELINKGLSFETGETKGMRGKVCPMLSIHTRCPDLDEGQPLDIGLHLVIYDYDDLRGALTRGDCANTATVAKMLKHTDDDE